MGIVHEVFWEGRRGGAWMDVLRSALVGSGVALADIVEWSGRGPSRLSVFLESRADACRLVSAFKFRVPGGGAAKMQAHRRTDWAARWKEGWKPFALTRRVHVIPLFLKKARCPKGKTPFYLDTTAAFGTGLHETTRFSAQIIEGLRGRFRSMLDVGTGTGILAAVAFMSGAVHVEAFDIDADAVKVARRNLKANGLRCAVLKACDVRAYRRARRFDLVAANLITHDLVAFKRNITACVAPGGWLVISGVSLKNVPVVRKAYHGFEGLECLKVVRGKEWAAFLLRKGAHDQ